MALSKEKEQKLIRMVQLEGCALARLDEQTEAICLEAVREDGLALQYVKEQTEAICIEAVKEDGWALKYISTPTEEMCLEAIKDDSSSLFFIQEKTDEIRSVCELIEEYWELKFPSYQTVRLKLAMGETTPIYSPYHLMDHFYQQKAYLKEKNLL